MYPVPATSIFQEFFSLLWPFHYELDSDEQLISLCAIGVHNLVEIVIVQGMVWTAGFYS